jgi:hypothetical protein
MQMKAILVTLLIAVTAQASYFIPPNGVKRSNLAAGAVGTPNYVSKTTAYSASSTDDIIEYNLVGQTATTLTLPSVSGLNNGKLIEVIRATSDTSMLSLHVKGTSSQLVGGLSDYQMWTPEERSQFIANTSDTSWHLALHNTDMVPINAGTITLTGSTTPPTKGTTTTDFLKLGRKGNKALLQVSYVQVTSGTDGSGAYEVNLPYSLTADTTEVPVNSSVVFPTAVAPGTLMGSFWGQNNSNMFWSVPVLHTSTKIIFVGSGNAAGQLVWGTGSSATFALSTCGSSCSFGGWIQVPILNWNP